MRCPFRLVLGGAPAAMTPDTYADLFEDDIDAVSGRLDSMRSKAVVGDGRKPLNEICPFPRRAVHSRVELRSKFGVCGTAQETDVY